MLEAKDQKLSMTKTLAELDAALANHDASAVIAVFAGEHLAPMTVSFWYSGNRAILVYQKADSDRRALRLAYEWARWVCRRTMTRDEGPALEVEAVHAAIDRARQALKRHQAIKACNSAIKNKAAEARTTSPIWSPASTRRSSNSWRSSRATKLPDLPYEPGRGHFDAPGPVPLDTAAMLT